MKLIEHITAKKFVSFLLLVFFILCNPKIPRITWSQLFLREQPVIRKTILQNVWINERERNLYLNAENSERIVFYS